ncbi:hypothetical protein [Microbacterium sp. NPDC090003]|uniref:hypothetical protein n=1 Tax=Microbacterium sp. NPDC090003 TaxID=3364203 RepID=UPI003808B1FA
MVKSTAPYADYTVRIGEEFPLDVYYDENLRGELLRIHHRVSRTPSRREFVVRPLRGATSDDRADIEEEIRNLRRVFRKCDRDGVPSRKWNRAGRFWFFVIYLGSIVNDPLVQLELEMMIDLEHEIRHDRASTQYDA